MTTTAMIDRDALILTANRSNTSFLFLSPLTFGEFLCSFRASILRQDERHLVQ
jgi:hypothetical protein